MNMDIEGVDALIADFRADPRNKVFVGE